MAQQPKSFWGATDGLKPEEQWLTTHDDWPLLALEAELIYAATSRGISWTEAQDLELWQIAAALGLHRVETRATRDAREIVETKRDYFEATKDQRLPKLAGYSEAREARRRERIEQRRQGSRKS